MNVFKEFDKFLSNQELSSKHNESRGKLFEKTIATENDLVKMFQNTVDPSIIEIQFSKLKRQNSEDINRENKLIDELNRYVQKECKLLNEETVSIENMEELLNEKYAHLLEIKNKLKGYLSNTIQFGVTVLQTLITRDLSLFKSQNF